MNRECHENQKAKFSLLTVVATFILGWIHSCACSPIDCCCDFILSWIHSCACSKSGSKRLRVRGTPRWIESSRTAVLSWARVPVSVTATNVLLWVGFRAIGISYRYDRHQLPLRSASATVTGCFAHFIEHDQVICTSKLHTPSQRSRVPRYIVEIVVAANTTPQSHEENLDFHNSDGPDEHQQGHRITIRPAGR
jgi:hypothetical protein